MDGLMRAILVRIVAPHRLQAWSRFCAHQAAGSATTDGKLARQSVQAVSAGQNELVVTPAALRAVNRFQIDGRFRIQRRAMTDQP